MTKPAQKIPSILLEGDSPALPDPPADQRFATAAAPPATAVQAEEPGLPLGYGTGRVLLTARDPYCLYANWDASPEQQRLCSDLPMPLLVRLHAGAMGGQTILELPVQPGTHHWFMTVERAGTDYVAEVGYRASDGEWRRIASSQVVATPGAGSSDEATARFATIHQETIANPVVTPKQTQPISLGPTPPGAEPAQFQAGAELGAIPAQVPIPLGPPPLGLWQEGGLDWTDAILPVDVEPGEGALSIAPTAGDLGPGGAEKLQLGSALPFEQLPELSSFPGGELPAPQDFGFAVNAELVVFGATDPSARVEIGGRTIPLRADGTFSLRFALPDGKHQLVLVATSVRGDVRRATLDFQRTTDYHVQTGELRADPGLSPPDMPPA